VRDANHFHHFEDGVCSCKDYWWCQQFVFSIANYVSFGVYSFRTCPCLEGAKLKWKLLKS
jgi:hypothetical protein